MKRNSLRLNSLFQVHKRGRWSGIGLAIEKNVVSLAVCSYARMLFLDFPARKRFYVLVVRQRGAEASLADSGTQWHACLTIVGNRKLKIILLYYNALGRVPSRAKVGSGQGRMRRAEAGHHHHFVLFARGFVARRPSPDQQWRLQHVFRIVGRHRSLGQVK